MAASFVDNVVAAPRNAGSSDVERKQTEHWLNLGYHNGERFVSLPMGIALDDLKPYKLNISNAEFRQFRADQNDFLSQIQELAASLKPGEEKMLNLQVQLRKVGALEEQETAPSSFKLETL